MARPGQRRLREAQWAGPPLLSPPPTPPHPRPCPPPWWAICGGRTQGHLSGLAPSGWPGGEPGNARGAAKCRNHCAQACPSLQWGVKGGEARS